VGQVSVNEAAIGRVIGALRTLEVDLGVALKASAQEMREAVDEIEAELQARRRKLDRAEATLSTARGAHERCVRVTPPVDCSGLARAVSSAERALTVARDQYQKASEARSRINATEADLARASARARSRIGSLMPAALSDCSRAMAQVANYLEGGTTVAAPGPGGAASVVQVLPETSDGGMGGTLGPVELVPLSSIDSSDSQVTGPASFEKLSWVDAQWSTDALASVVAPAVSQGKGRDYFVQRDGREGRSGLRSYAGVYDSYFGSDRAIKLTRGSGGRLSVINGYHRIWAAEQAGMTSIPARVRR
jgi:hypothetical protein